MSFGDHLEELRSCLVRSLVGVASASVVCLYFGKGILAFICRPLLTVQYANGLPPQLQVLAPTGAFVAYLKIAVLSGLVLSMPWVIYQVWVFVATGLYSHERRFVRHLVPASLGLFVIGVLFLYFLVLPIVLQFFVSFNKRFSAEDLTPTGLSAMLLPKPEADFGADPTANPELRIVPLRHRDPENPADGALWVNRETRRLMYQTPTGVWSMPFEVGRLSSAMHSQFAIDYYTSFVLMLALAFGIAFETPIVVFFLAWSRIVTTSAMRRARRYVLLGTVVAAAILTPPDVVSQLLLAGPMYLLFELGVVVASVVEKRERPDPIA